MSNFAEIKLEGAGDSCVSREWGWWDGSLGLGLLWAHPWELLHLQYWNCTGVSPSARGLRVGKIC